MTTTTATKPKATKSKTKSAAEVNPHHEPAAPTPNVDLSDYSREFWAPRWAVYPKPDQQRKQFKQSRINSIQLSMGERGNENNGQQESVKVIYRPIDDETLRAPTWDDDVLLQDEPPSRGRPMPIRRDALIYGPNGEKPYLMIKTGETRHRARIQGGYEFIRVKLVPPVDGLDMEIEHGIENMNREQLSMYEEVLYYGKLQDEYGLTLDEIASRLGVSQAQKFRIRWRLELRKLSPRWMEVVKNECINVVYNNKPLRIEIGGDPCRVAAEILPKADPVTGEEKTSAHIYQDLMLDYIIREAQRTGKLMPLPKIKAMRDNFNKPSPESQDLDFVMPKSESTEEALALFKKRITVAWKQLHETAESQKAGSAGHIMGCLGDVEGKNIAQILHTVEQLAAKLRKQVDEALVANFTTAAKKLSDGASLDDMGGDLSIEDVMNMIGK